MEVKKIILNGCSYTHGCDITFKENNIKCGFNVYYFSFNSFSLSLNCFLGSILMALVKQSMALIVSPCCFKIMALL